MNVCLEIIGEYRNGLASADELNLDIPKCDEDKRDLIEWYVQRESVRMFDRIIEVIKLEKVQERCSLKEEVQRLKKEKNELLDRLDSHDLLLEEDPDWEEV